MPPKTRAILTVHLAGWPCDMDPIMDLAAESGLKVIEDCAQAHGATYKGRKVGSIGDVAAFSFCQDKIITTGGEGGMLTTNSEEIWSYIWSYKDHGKSYDAVYHQEHPVGFRWLHHHFGSNWRMTEMQAAMGRIQLQALDQSLHIRRGNAATLHRGFSDISALRLPDVPEFINHAYYKYYVFIRSDSLKNGWDRDRVILAINEEGVPCFGGSCSEIYLEKSFSNAGIFPMVRLPVARALGEQSLMFVVHPTLNENELQTTIAAVRKVFSHASQ
ncbi:MAG: DegT/DnrJ/EryC1/StrS aminotransferase family protein [Zetaproteobacteria bacterium]|nr:DegT/DnrJ/EryC1/StrS aminotransferase family protein [Zetaproteobacteria bacterium]